MGTPTYIISQIFGVLTTVNALISSQQKKMNVILLIGIFTNLFAAASNCLLGAYSGTGVCLVAIAQTVVSYFCDRKNKPVPLWATALFIIGYLGITALTFRGPLDILPGVAAMLYAAAVLQKNPFVYRILMVLNPLCWIFYNILPGIPNISLIITFILELSFMVAGIIRIDIIGRLREKKN
ncbi:MAG: YgjV family protein [Clostridia bacterium]|nr:YgjV family protein [Clostridia bacterium]